MSLAKHILVTLALSAFSNLAAFCQIIDKTTSVKDGLYGMVKEVKTVHFTVDTNEFGRVDTDTTYTEVSSYDMAGRLLHRKMIRSRFRHPSDPVHNIAYKYDKNGNLVDYTDDILFPTTIRFRYDERNRLTEERTYNENRRLVSRKRYIYVNGWLVRSESEYTDNKMPHNVLRYDHWGNETEHCQWREDETGKRVMIFKHDHTYDEKNRLIETLSSNYSTGETERQTYRYDEHGNEKEVAGYDNERLTWRTTNRYDAGNHLVKAQKYDKDGKLAEERRYKYVYDDNGRLLSKKETIVNPYHTTHITERYTAWDNNGNWLIQENTLTDETKKQVWLVSRTIKYYD